MKGFDDEFMEFLRTNHPTDYLKACSDDVKPETLTRIFSDYSSYFNTWIKIPESIRNYYRGIVPHEFMELAAEGQTETLKRIAEKNPPKLQEKDVEEYTPPSPEAVMATQAFVAACLAGYSQEASYALAYERMFRDSLREKALNHTMTDEDKKAWRKSRENDIKTIKKEWSTKQPEKMLIHLFAKFNRGRISEEELMPRIAELMQKIETEGRREHLLAYLQDRRIQRKLGRFKPEVLEMLSHTILHDLPIKENAQSQKLDNLSVKMEIRNLIDAANQNNSSANLPQQVSNIVDAVKKSGNGLDLKNYSEDSEHPMPSDLRQMFMAACCAQNVDFIAPDGEQIKTSTKFVQNLPPEMQAMIISHDLSKAKENMLRQTGSDGTVNQPAKLIRPQKSSARTM